MENNNNKNLLKANLEHELKRLDLKEGALIEYDNELDKFCIKIQEKLKNHIPVDDSLNLYNEIRQIFTIEFNKVKEEKLEIINKLKRLEE